MKIKIILGVFLTAALVLPGLESGPGASEAATPVPLNPKKVAVSNGPLKLVFEVANTKVRENDSLWVKLTLVNIGTRTIKIADAAFGNILALAEGDPLRIEVREAVGGRALRRAKRDGILLTETLQRCLERYEKEHPAAKAVDVWVLPPGKSISTPGRLPESVYAMAACEGDPKPVKFPPYGEIPNWEWTGRRYQVRAVMDRSLNPKFEKFLTPEGRKLKQYGVILTTGWVDIEILR